jgi:hypothetical protein
MTVQSALILEKQLEAARQEIATLRTLTNYTVAVIVASGGRIEIPDNKIEEWSRLEWRHESDGLNHVFTTGDAA